MRFVSKISSAGFYSICKTNIVLGWFYRRTKTLIPPKNLWMTSSQMTMTTLVKEVSWEWWLNGSMQTEVAGPLGG